MLIKLVLLFSFILDIGINVLGKHNTYLLLYICVKYYNFNPSEI